MGKDGCQMCKMGHAKQGGKCHVKIPHCKSYAGDGKCQKCEKEYEVENGKCIKQKKEEDDWWNDDDWNTSSSSGSSSSSGNWDDWGSW